MYIVFDLVFNQDFSEDISSEIIVNKFPFEIIQIGALIMVKAAITALIHWEWKSKDVMTEIDDID